MALVPKLASASTAISTSVPRPTASARVASLGGGVIDQAAISTGTFFDTSPYEYTETHKQARNDDSPNSPNRQKAAPRREHFGVINATSEAFASLLDYDPSRNIIDDFGNVHQPTSPSVVNQAISTYELNSQVISGNTPVLGTEISLTL